MLVSACLPASLCSPRELIFPIQTTARCTESLHHQQRSEIIFFAQKLPTEKANHHHHNYNGKKLLSNNSHYYYCSYYYHYLSGGSREARGPLLLLLRLRRKSLLSRRSWIIGVPHCLAAEPSSASSSSSSSDLGPRSSVAAEGSLPSRDAFAVGSSSSPTVREATYADRGSSSSKSSVESNGCVTAAGVASKASSTSAGGSFQYANTVGILGGLAPLATVEFMRKIVEATDGDDETDHIPLVLCSNPHFQKSISPGLLVPRMSSGGAAAAAAGAAEMELVAVELLLENRRLLERAGAKCIVMPCHVSHLWYDQLAEGCSVPFLHMADCVVEELKAANLQPLEPGSKPKIGVLGTQASIATEFYNEKLRSQGFDVALPDQATMEHAVIPGIAALQRGDMEGARNLLRIAVQVLLVNAVNLVLLVCHNTPTAFSADDPVLRKCIDPADALARATVQWSRSMKGMRTS